MFCRDCEGDEPHWTVRCRARLIFSEFYSLELPLWLGAQPRNSRFYAYLTLTDRRDFRYLLFPRRYDAVRTRIVYVPGLDNVDRSFVRIICLPIICAQ